jgi:cyclopropane fatty-acyl-phospholipid synthase-like methyltransferase
VLLTVDLERLELRRGERLLDAGCGEGRHCFGALDRGVHVVGLDLDLSGLRAPRVRLAIRATVSRGLSRLEKILNFCFPKSVILYAEKRR